MHPQLLPPRIRISRAEAAGAVAEVVLGVVVGVAVFVVLAALVVSVVLGVGGEQGGVGVEVVE